MPELTFLLIIIGLFGLVRARLRQVQPWDVNFGLEIVPNLYYCLYS